MRRERVTILNRAQAQTTKFGLDGSGVEWTTAGEVWASVEWARGKSALMAGALDAYSVVMVRMNWNDLVGMRSRIVHNEQVYQIVPETFHADKHGNTIQFNAQAVVENY